MKIKCIIATLAAAFLVGCASTGNNFDESKISQIKKGESTEADLTALFGTPQNRTVDSEGTTMLSWVYAETKVKGESFIPYAGAFLGGGRSKSKTLNVALLDGKVKSYTLSGGAGESRGTTQDVPKK